ncbi:M15 family metallopeptidase [Legionella pneumophila serogroup 1]|uniref:M15 family metallopeptidase n=1 Tax=Legionella pneumophila TaxID=446 RepID=UPI0005B4A186|nr:M15 family metallopeptidase [Legionella pneumophila]HAT8946683.1 D-alanyl-D-alanine dipeptidase [Legionella pneumophila subsp. pneumophila]AMV15629.1 D-alanyl-D-alanine dipeptidase [Legionella pneumophila]ANN93615.1 D-alanyl-D-alanine dipeptidase [Legionella pneumophila]MCH9060148.1 M15 family metallopeptidase [Legionella pneumophila serogroup 1]MCH9064963.1 M15 family metallopeptidase [Legionella pneumophila serogroup 1]
MKKISALIFLSLISMASFSLPKGFVYLHDVAPDIIEDIRYATHNNFIGNPIPGYKRGVCIVTRQTAQQLKKAEEYIKPKGYTLKVYDCYRPQRAVDYFYKWSRNAKDNRMKPEFYPREIKQDLFDRGYIALTSGHTRGSTLDLTLVKLTASQEKKSNHPLTRCYDKKPGYLDDDSIDTGTRFDCLDVSANIDYSRLSKNQKANRKLLQKLMSRFGFRPYYYEWWHFTLKNEPYPDTYFNFPVE